MPDIRARGIIPYVFCADAGAVADWCVSVLGFVERERWPDENGVVRNVELIVGDSEVWLDGPVPDWKDRTGGLGSWTGFLVDDVDSVYEQLVAAGVGLEASRTRDHSVREITVEDPEGHAWGFVQRLTDA
ncbi:VOC family protein [Ilumatobacter nonamiensis]|uniref:VOC family protein n=1 Tax=Ilumatobacter nonamiensis TaxID=467093 RepID=UPI00034C54C4|nr:VOC family protein [Ilumatobacter nonamiensis]